MGDRLWHPTVPFAGRTACFPGPVAALRTLKSDAVIGPEQGALDALERTGAAWRTSGTHALVPPRPWIPDSLLRQAFDPCDGEHRSASTRAAPRPASTPVVRTASRAPPAPGRAEVSKQSVRTRHQGPGR
ncbi:hypothetical protein GCM10010275_19240 [Streptomyces litmocidini]|nr:hypothetical protein GCM10010275_19240 [Streptomyces litmocidini]